MKAVLAAIATLTLTTAIPAWAQSQSPEAESSDRYRRDTPEVEDQQAQTPAERGQGEIEALRREHMSSPNIRGEQVPENPATGAAAPEQGPQQERHEGGVRP